MPDGGERGGAAVTVSVIGLGYVGTVALACLARDGHTVIGVDVDPGKLAMIAEGKTPVVEEGTVDLLKQVVASGRVRVSADVRTAVLDSDITLICVGTPSAANGSQDRSALMRVTTELGLAIKDKTTPHVVVFRSTMVPGTVEDVLAPLMEVQSGKTEGVDFHVCFQPEFLREGSSIRDYDHPPFTIVGANAEFPVEQVRKLVGHLPCEFIVTSVRAAEMVKYCCNNFHALKITFANETARLCHALGIDPFQVMSLVVKDTQLNISPAYLKPGFAFGGSCLPKDLRATMHLARTHDVDLPMLGSILSSNHAHLDVAIAKVMARHPRRVGMLGLSFKQGTDDLRESPAVMLAEYLIGKGVSLRIYDPDVRLSNLLGANRRFIDEHLPHIGTLLDDNIADVIGQSDVVIAGINNARVVEGLKQHLRDDQLVVDLVNIRDRAGMRGTFEGLCW
jgi:GDP-mannose 6-dehydrogenase